jgi:hypothetical protein
VRFIGTTSEYIVDSISGTLVKLTSFFDIGVVNVNDTITFIGDQFPTFFYNSGTFVSTGSFTNSKPNNIIAVTNTGTANATYRFHYYSQQPVVATISDTASINEYGSMSTGSVYNLKGTVYANQNTLQVAYSDPDGVNTNTFQVNISTTITNTSSTDLVTVDLAHQWLPAGSIIMWSKPRSTIPHGWWLCDGSPTPNGVTTPDLRNRFVVGADSELNDIPTVTDRTNSQIAQGGTTQGVLLSHSHSGTATTFAVYDPGHNHLAVGPNTTSPFPAPADNLKGPYDPSPQIKTFWGFTAASTPIAVQWQTGGERLFRTQWEQTPTSHSGIELETRITVRNTGTDRSYTNLPQYKSLYFIYKWMTASNADIDGVYALPPSAGTLLSFYCNGRNKMGVYADGNNGIYNQLIEYNSTDCGYVEPNEAVSGPIHVAPGVGFTANISGGAPNSSVSWTVTPPGGVPGSSLSANLDGAGTGVFNNVVLTYPPGQYTYTFTFSATGNVRTYKVIVDYTYNNGFQQEYNLTADQLTLAKLVGKQLYGSNNAFSVNINGSLVTRWGLYRVPDTEGLLFWVRGFPGVTTLTQDLIDSFFGSAENDADNPRSNTSNKTQLTVQPPWYGDFDGRPVL